MHAYRVKVICACVCRGGLLRNRHRSGVKCVKYRQADEGGELGSKGFSKGCKKEKGSCFQPDLAQREGVSLMSGAFMWVLAISLSQYSLSDAF